LSIYFYSYKAEFVQEILRKGEKKLAQSFNYTFRYIDDVIYPVELVVKDTTDSPKSAFYLDLEHDINCTLQLKTKFYDKRDDFNFPIVNYPFLDSNIPPSPAYGVYMLQLNRYSRTCNSYQDFLNRSVLLTRKLLSQGFIETRLRSTSFLVVTII